jgi:hypothetical protein
MRSTCEACEKTASDTIESCDDTDSPYHLCSACHQRLLARALRPLEWYNLAKRHGWWQPHLHDDFYDEDGTASQPDFDVETPELYPAPTLADVENKPELLLDFTITRWYIEDPVAKAWQSHPRDIILQTLTRRFAETANIGIRSAILEVAASALGDTGAEFVKHAWDDYPDAVDLPSLAKASASCLPHREGFGRVVKALSTCEDREKRELMFSLLYFHSQDTLDWIENNIFSPITESWGYLAAASEFDWARAKKWLECGRPLSLASLDAIAEIIRPKNLLLRNYSPRLRQPPDSDELTTVLESHADYDSAPRVKMVTKFILKNAAVITKSG